MEIKDIKLRNPKTCNHCAAFFMSMGGSQMCSLGYATEKETDPMVVWKAYNTWHDVAIKIKPAEPCPKPKNVKECVEIRATGLNVFRQSDVTSPEYKKNFKR